MAASAAGGIRAFDARRDGRERRREMEGRSPLAEVRSARQGIRSSPSREDDDSCKRGARANVTVGVFQGTRRADMSRF